MKHFSEPNDANKDPVNRMIRTLIVLRNRALRGSKSMPKFTSHGNPKYIEQGEIDLEFRKYANIRILDNLISQLENIVS